jgi:hypothetical protein
VGANGLVLTADSAQTLGVGWAVPATQSHAHGGSAGDGGVIAYLPLTGGTLTGALTLQGAAAATNVLQAKLAADTQPRFRADASGRLEWGPGGSTAPAAALYRNGTGALETTASVLPDATNTRSLGSAATAWSSVWGLLLQTPNTGSLVLGVSLPASAGAIRLRNAANGQIAWRNAGNTADVTLGVDASDRFAFTSDLLVSEATPTVALQQAADTQPRARLSDTALAFGPGGTTAPDTTLQRTGAQQAGLNATLTVTPAAGQPALAWSATGSLGASGSQAVVNSGAALLFGATGFAGPVADNSIACGWSDKRWTQILAVAGTINTSLAEAKQDITPLDPAAALAAVLHTDPVVFDYKAPERTAEWYELPDDPEQAEAVLYQRLTGAPLEAAARHQAGFVLQDATGTYHTDPAFETGSGQSSPQNSVGVLIGAIHALAARVAALEGA